MSPTVFRYKDYRFFFFSKEEKRIHVHISSSKGEAKFWLEPVVALAEHYRLDIKELKQLHKILEKRKDELVKAWNKHFRG